MIVSLSTTFHLCDSATDASIFVLGTDAWKMRAHGMEAWLAKRKNLGN